MQSKSNKKIYLAVMLVLALFLGLAAEATASHFRYGHITWTRDSGTSQTVTFKIQTAWRVLFGGGDTRLFFGDGGSQTGADTFVGSFTDLAGATYVVHERFVTHTYPTLGTFEATNSTCCRIGGLGNSASSWILRTTVDLSDPNQLSSSVGSVTPLLQMAQGLNSIPIGVADPDGAVSCRMATGTESGISSIATATSGALSVSPSCVLNWDATTAPDFKKYAVQVMLLEGTNKTALDFLIEINPASTTNQSPACELNGVVNNTLSVGQAFSISATASDPDGDNLKVSHLGLPSGATLAPVNGTTQASPATATFNWTPGPADQGTGHSVLLVFTDTANQSCQTSFSVNIPSAPVNQAPDADAGVDQVIEQIASGNTSVILDGSGSSDPDNDPLTYTWSGDASATSVNPTVSLAPGTHNITLTVSDGPASDSDSVQINVQDTIAPAVTVTDRTEEATGSSTAVDVTGNATATDAVGVVTLTNDSLGSFAVGSHTVIWTACDAAGNCSSAPQTVTVEDTIAPVITTTDNTVEATATNTPADVSGDASATDAVGVVSLTNDSPGSFTVGSHTVTWTACDAAGNCSSAPQTVTVEDTIAPVITTTDNTVEATAANTPVDVSGDASATDAVGVVSLTNDSPGSFAVGSHTVIWTACDAAGNCSSEPQTVTVEDTIAPVITTTPVTVEATDPSTPVDVTGTATATDAVGVLPLTNDSSGSFTVGSHTVTWTACDAANNCSTETQTVTVTDTTAPDISNACLTDKLWPPNHKMVLVSTGSFSDLGDVNPTISITVASNQPINGTGDGNTDPDWEAVDNGDGTYSVSLRAERAGNIGQRDYTTTVTATDASGNTSEATCSASVPHDQGKNNSPGTKKGKK